MPRAIPVSLPKTIECTLCEFLMLLRQSQKSRTIMKLGSLLRVYKKNPMEFTTEFFFCTYFFIEKRGTGVEPALKPWEGLVIPIYQPRERVHYNIL